MTDQIRKVSKKKILFVQIDEEIPHIFERIVKLPYKEVYLVVPKYAVLLQSIVNLKILKQKLLEIDKTMALVTNDVNGMKLATQAEVKVFDQWDLGEQVGPKRDDQEPGVSLLKPIAATQNEISDPLPNRLPKKKSSIFEIVRGRKDKGKGFSLRSYLSDMKKNRLERKPLGLYLTPGKKRWVAALLAGSVMLFFMIAYIALPGATLSIEPASSVITKAVNVILESNPRDARSIQSVPVSTTATLSINHTASGIESKGENASGLLTIINKSGVERPLISQTRFQTDGGVVFRIQKEAIVPSGSSENPGTLEVNVIADTLDANGVPVGDRGNIEPSRFFLPGLKEDSRDALYAESYAAMTGGTRVVEVYVTEDDLMAAKSELENQLKDKAIAALRKEVLSQGSSANKTLKLLEDSDTLTYGTAVIELPYALIGQKLKTFDVVGTMTIKGVAYDWDALVSILKAEIVSAKTPGKQLTAVQENTISLQVLEADNTNRTYKVTAQIQGIEEYEINPELDGGNRLADKIKEHVAGKSVKEAENYIQNLPEVNKVEISMWPVWSVRLPSLPENIKIKSMSKNDPVE